MSNHTDYEACLPPGSTEQYIDDLERGLLDQAKQIGRLAELVRTIRHQRWPEGAPQNSAARELYDVESEQMIQAAIDGNT